VATVSFSIRNRDGVSAAARRSLTSRKTRRLASLERAFVPIEANGPPLGGEDTPRLFPLSVSLSLFVGPDNWCAALSVRSAGKCVSRSPIIRSAHAGRNFAPVEDGEKRKQGAGCGRRTRGSWEREARALFRGGCTRRRRGPSQLRGDWLRRYALIESINERQ